MDPSIPPRERFWGEVTKVETLNYRTYKPEPGGLFCERIFGPTKNWECYCGKYKAHRYKGIVCDRCGVKVTRKSVRRERAGFIQLAVPVVHPWFSKSLSNTIGILTNISSKNLEKIINYEKYVVINPGVASRFDIKKLDILSDNDYWNIMDAISSNDELIAEKTESEFIAKMGGEAIEILLKDINLDELEQELKYKSEQEQFVSKRQEILKRLTVVKYFKDSAKRNNKPEYMVIRILTVIPADLRPLVQLDGGKLASADINELYRKVIVKNNRLKNHIENGSPDIILRNEKRMLQEAVDMLIDKSQNGDKEYKSFSDSLLGKKGLFRFNLLGKRVDYSGRCVIIPGPGLELHQCGLPKEAALEVFKPLVIRGILNRRIVETVKAAKKIIEKKSDIVWEVLESVLKGHPILLNRAPTLHRLSIQAFQPILIEGKAVQLHPLLCTPFNADFDGDQMAIHLPLSTEAIVESIILMLSSQNIFSPANGKAMTLPSKDMVLGIYYITNKYNTDVDLKGSGIIFSSKEELIYALSLGVVDIHASIKLRKKKIDSLEETEIIETTPGRVLFNNLLPEDFDFINEVVAGKKIQQLVSQVYEKKGIKETVEFLDKVKTLGFEYAYKSGLSIGINDLKVPAIKRELIESAQKEVDQILYYYISGIITDNERYNKVVDVWTRLTMVTTSLLIKELKEDQNGFNPLFVMYESGARGSKEQLRQLVSQKGLVAKPQNSGSNQTIETPILSSFKEGLDSFDYIIASHGSRKGLADTALKTSDAGYLTRRLVEVAQDVKISLEDCGTVIGSIENHIYVDGEIVERISERILGKISVNDIYNPKSNDLIVKKNEIILEKQAEEIDLLNLKNIEVRNIFNCLSEGKGVCAKCYGINFATGKLVQIGDAVGIVAAQSIGEPGTQLTLRTFHVGGSAATVAVESNLISKHEGKVVFSDLKTIIINSNGNEEEIVISRSTKVNILGEAGEFLLRKQIPYGSSLKIKNGDKILKDQEICSWDPYNGISLAEQDGTIEFSNLELDITYADYFDEKSSTTTKVIIESKTKNISPFITLHMKNGDKIVHNLPVKARLLVENGEIVKAGKILYKIPRVMGVTKDITGGFPKVTELFEVRNMFNAAILSEIEGVASYGETKKGLLEIFIDSKAGIRKKYYLPLSSYVLVQPNDYVKAGDKLSEGSICPANLLEIKGIDYLQKYFVNELQEVYRLQGVKINDKHMEVIILRMIARVEILDSGDTGFIIGSLVDKKEFRKKNNDIFFKKIITDAGDSTKYNIGDLLSIREVIVENTILSSLNKKTLDYRDAKCATAKPKICGITRVSLGNEEILAAASFQEPTKILSEAAIKGSIDYFTDLKSRVISGQLPLIGTGMHELQDDEEVESIFESRKNSHRENYNDDNNRSYF